MVSESKLENERSSTSSDGNSYEKESLKPRKSREVVEDNGDKSEFVRKYGPVKFQWIERPESASAKRLVVKPHALNYFHNGVLYRTKETRGSAVFELFFDLLYVGIVANLAESCIEESTGISLATYILLFLPCWQIWADMREFMDYYYNNDLTQKIYVLWIMTLLVVYANNAKNFVKNDKGLIGLVVGCYMLARFTFATVVLIYNLVYIKEHRRQMVWYCCFVYLAVILAGFIIFPKSMHVKIILASVLYAWDIIIYTISFSPWFKKILKANYSTAVNIEHEIERHSAFVIIAIGEFLYVIVSKSPASMGLNERTARAICILIISYTLAWFYFSGEGSTKALHAIRRDSIRAAGWFHLHIPLVISLVLSADAAGALTTTPQLYPVVHHHVSKRIEAAKHIPRDNYLHDVQIYFGAGLAIAIMCITFIGLLDKGLENNTRWKLSPKVRVLPRFAIAAVILGMAFADMKITLYLGLSALFLSLQLLFENLAEVECEVFHHDTGIHVNLAQQYEAIDHPLVDNSSA